MKISKKQIEYAIEALRANNIITNDNQYPKVFKGYISSFGAAVIQSGLIPAIIFFENEDNDANADRHKIIGVLKDIKSDSCKLFYGTVYHRTWEH